MLNMNLFNILHLLGVVLLFISLIFSGYILFKNTQKYSSELSVRKICIGIQHFALTILIVSGFILLSMKNFQVETWFYAKIILFFVMVSSVIKAFKKDDTILLVQRRAGWTIAFIAFIAIYGLVQIQPTF
ncbi:invasion protein expression up-regulator SirB [Acinetobacter sp. ANC 4558]|nr:invasion protein expression up-regulator SirB [Acinetobacter sp. ANC 4558]